MRYHILRMMAGLLLASVSHLASAGLLGTSIAHCADSPYTGLVTANPGACDPVTVQPQPASALVGGGVEFDITGNRFFDFADDTLTIDYVQPVGSDSPDLLIFTLERNVASVMLPGANPLAVSWTFADNRLGILVDAPLLSGSVILRIGTAEVAVPEPAPLALSAFALSALAASRRRRVYSVPGSGAWYRLPS